jgi:hypothetical protein
MELKRYCVYVSESPIIAIRVDTEDEANNIAKLASPKHVCITTVTTNINA